jgi:hypothetical protein
VKSEKKLKHLPLGEQIFKDIIEKNKLYVDKTDEIYKLLETEEKYFFLSRPRRFGKSLLVSTLEEIFLGNKELFKGLYIYDKIEFKKYPVINLSLNKLNYTKNTKDFELSLLEQIKRIYEKYNIKLNTDNYKTSFDNLIYELSKIDKVVLLIDEYDKPIIEYIEDIERSKEMRDILKNFYETIKANDQYIHFAFLTGVSKFSKVSVFSALNNITDITINKHYSKIVGIDESQLYLYFKEYIEKLSEENKISVEEIKKVLRKWYNGYSWDGKNFLYNPYSLLSVFNSGDISNYWFKTGTPTFLINLIKKYKLDIKNLDNIIANESDFDSYEVDNMNVMALLFQTGYLTIKKITEKQLGKKKYLLSYPNMEVKESLVRSLLNNFAQNNQSNGISVDELVESLEEKNLKRFFQILNSMFGTIPNEIFPKDSKLDEKEAYYHTIFHLIFTLIGTSIHSEVSVSKGRIDSVVETDNNIFIFEFKVGRTPKKAIEQIELKNYYEAYSSSKKEIILVGVNFSISKRNIKDWKIKNAKT